MADTVIPTLGQSRVRASFNPSGNVTVDTIKRLAANFIDLCESLKVVSITGPNEQNRILAIAQKEIESATMWAVKAATSVMSETNVQDCSGYIPGKTDVELTDEEKNDEGKIEEKTE